MVEVLVAGYYLVSKRWNTFEYAFVVVIYIIVKVHDYFLWVVVEEIV